MAFTNRSAESNRRVVLPHLLRRIQHPLVMPVHPVPQAVPAAPVAATGCIKSPALAVMLVARAAHGGVEWEGSVLALHSTSKATEPHLPP
jgi:hypothetical protein